MSEDFPDCMACGEPVEECRCGGCQVCGAGWDCEHLRERRKGLLRIKRRLESRLAECPNCINRAVYVDNDGFPENEHGYCPLCGLQGPTCKTVPEAVEAWNKLPRRPGPQTAAVLAELVELLKEPYPYVRSDIEEWTCVVGIKDREVFLKEQGVES